MRRNHKRESCPVNCSKNKFTARAHSSGLTPKVPWNPFWRRRVSFALWPRWSCAYHLHNCKKDSFSASTTVSRRANLGRAGGLGGYVELAFSEYWSSILNKIPLDLTRTTRTTRETDNNGSETGYLSMNYARILLERIQQLTWRNLDQWLSVGHLAPA